MAGGNALPNLGVFRVRMNILKNHYLSKKVPKVTDTAVHNILPRNNFQGGFGVLFLLCFVRQHPLAEFHDTDTDTDSPDTPTSLRLTRDFLVRNLARMSVSVSWNAALGDAASVGGRRSSLQCGSLVTIWSPSLVLVTLWATIKPPKLQ